MSVTSISGAAAAPAAGNASAIAALQGKQKKIMQQLKATQSDTSLDAKAKSTKLASLQAQLQMIDAQIQQLRAKQQQPAAKAAPAAESEPHEVKERPQATATKTASDTRAPKTSETGHLVDVVA